MELKNLSPEHLEKLKKIGDLLRKKREELNYSLENVADITRISISMLRTLESGNFQEFAPLIFMRGFLRNYCKFLGIDSDKSVEDFNTIYTLEDSQNEINLREAGKGDAVIHKKHFAELKKSFFYLFGLIFVIGLGSYFFYNFLFFTPQAEKGKIIELIGEGLIEQKPEEEHRQMTKTLTLEIEGLKVGWLRLSADQNAPIEVKIKEGFTYRWNAENSIRLILGRSDMAKILLNNEIQTTDPKNSDQLTEFHFQKQSP